MFLGLHQPLTGSFTLRSIIDSFLRCGALIGRRSLYLAINEKTDENKGEVNSSSGSFWSSVFFEKSSCSTIQPAQVLQVDRQEFLKELQIYGQSRGWRIEDPVIWQDIEGPSKDSFSSDFSMIQQSISDGEIEKAVPVTWEKFSYSFDEEGIWRHLTLLLQNAHENLIPYGYWSVGEQRKGQRQGMLGATPEVLFESQDGDHFQTMALAGTVFDEKTEDSSFLADPKELSEHQYVVSFIKEKLESLANQVTLGETSVLPISSLRHLYTPIHFSFSNSKTDPQFLMDLFHPTPALGVVSDKVDWHWLERLSGQKERCEFGAPFGFSHQDGRMLFVVGIRNIMWSGSEGRLGAGCGIVKESQLEKEWNELAAKRHSVKKLFGIL